MSRRRKPRPLRLLIEELERSDVLESEQANAVRKASRKLERAIQSGSRKEVFSTVNQFAKIFLLEVQRNG